ncbi:MAG: hypothetical protein LQ346_005960 [Caloplaca aetnensis]|nr:MAG: hypothetical protein LQ346_005960 [Caloplaca aetnensis]
MPVYSYESSDAYGYSSLGSDSSRSRSRGNISSSSESSAWTSDSDATGQPDGRYQIHRTSSEYENSSHASNGSDGLSNSQASEYRNSPRRSSKPTPYICLYPQCDQAFARSFDLNRHQQTHFPIPAIELDCPKGGEGGFCGRVGDRGFARQDHLDEHLRKVHLVGIRTSRKGRTYTGHSEDKQSDEVGSRTMIQSGERGRQGDQARIAEIDQVPERPASDSRTPGQRVKMEALERERQESREKSSDCHATPRKGNFPATTNASTCTQDVLNSRKKEQTIKIPLSDEDSDRNRPGSIVEERHEDGHRSAGEDDEMREANVRASQEKTSKQPSSAGRTTFKRVRFRNTLSAWAISQLERLHLRPTMRGYQRADSGRT